jgi:hypothetical protein
MTVASIIAKLAKCRRDRLHVLGGGDETAWLGREDSNSEMSWQNIPLKGRMDFRKSSRIPATETVRVSQGPIAIIPAIMF